MQHPVGVSRVELIQISAMTDLVLTAPLAITNIQWILPSSSIDLPAFGKFLQILL